MNFSRLTIKLLIITGFFIFPIASQGQISTLRPEIDKIVAGKKLKMGIALLDLSNGDTLSIYGNHRFPMQSIFKLHLGLAMLHEVDRGRFALDDTVRFDSSELYSHLWSPIQKAWPNGYASLPLGEVIRYTIGQSDNSGCDKLFRLLGGPGKVNDYIRSLGITETNIANIELEIQADWNVQFSNYTTPLAAIELLKKIDTRSFLTSLSHRFLWETLLGTSTGSIRKGLPEGAQVAYKTGFSGQNGEGETAANNNIGILMLPDGRRIAYAVFITASTEPQEVNYDVIARIGKCIYESR